MSILGRFIEAVSLPESEDARGDARAMAHEATTPGDWLSLILAHHVGIEQAFAEVSAADTNTSRTLAFRRLGVLLLGHAIAEEAIIYPEMAQRRDRSASSLAYDEQAMLKIELAVLEKLNPMSPHFLNKLAHVRESVAHHIYAEEGKWFLDLKRKVSAGDQMMMTERYAEEYSRYVGADG